VSFEAASATELGDFAALLDPRRMDWVISFGWQALAAVDDIRMEFAGNVLIKRAAETHVEALAAIADGEDGLTSGKSMFQDSEVGPLAISVGVVGLLLARRVVQRGVDISRCARENKSVQVRDLGGKLGRRQFERNGNGLAIGMFDRRKVKLQLIGDVAFLFLGGAPGDANTRAAGTKWVSGALLGVSRGHRT